MNETKNKFLIISLVVFNLIAILNASPVKNLKIDSVFVEDDILMPITKSLSSNENENNKWPNGIVPYLISSQYSSSQRSVILGAMNMITTKTGGCIQFSPKTASDPNWIHIQSISGCYSYIGNIGRGEQEVSISRSGCVYTGTIVHELCHALGFWHEQNRADRDEYVTINFGNIQSGKESNFNKYSSGIYHDTPYDYYSIMHYSRTAFSSNGQDTIIPKQSGVSLIPSYGKTDDQILTAYDIQAIRARYQCSSQTQATQATQSTQATQATQSTQATTTSGNCVNDPSCQYYTDNKDTYCSASNNYFLPNGISFRSGCRLLCGLCNAPPPPTGNCQNEWFCDLFETSASQYCSQSGTIYTINDIPFRTACPVLCNSCPT